MNKFAAMHAFLLHSLDAPRLPPLHLSQQHVVYLCKYTNVQILQQCKLPSKYKGKLWRTKSLHVDFINNLEGDSVRHHVQLYSAKIMPSSSCSSSPFSRYSFTPIFSHPRSPTISQLLHGLQIFDKKAAERKRRNNKKLYNQIYTLC